MADSFPTTHLFLSFIIFITLLLSSPGVYSAKFIITNKCDYPVWPGLNAYGPDEAKLPTTGFALQPGESNNVSIPKSWSGRVWGRTFCTQNATTGNFSCLTGDCASSTVQCPGINMPVIPATSAEFYLNSSQMDYYDINLVEGYNFPMLVSPHGGTESCTVIGCVGDVNPACPAAEVSVVDNSSGETVACESACPGNFGCCMTAANGTQTPYSSFLKVACLRPYEHPFDIVTSTFSCSGADYAITFCPKTSCTTTRDGQTTCVDPTADTKNATNTIVDTKNATNTSVDTKKEDKFAGWKLGLAVCLPGVGILILIVYFFMRKLSSTSFLHWRKAENNSSIEAFLKKHGSLAPTIYTYSQVKKMTNSFNDKLGQGGFGTVFKGKLPDGRQVAVKVLKESKKDGEEFINEVASISQTSHVNVVSLLGFCFEGSKRALLYEYMVKGSLEKHIYEENPSGADRQLGWEALYQIALGIARGLEYLHRGCNTRILHFDIKPHNILLDDNFCPKISDFGLARVCPEKESIISKVTARGTPGYTAPEFFFRNLGGISHKSDVYSYGLMVLEMVGGRRNLCVGGDKTSEIYFPGWVHKRLQLDEELGVPGISNEEENQIARKLITVSLWCIQTSPWDRPSMGRVVEMLQGTLDSLQIPPRPNLFSPPRSPDRSIANSSMTSASTIEL